MKRPAVVLTLHFSRMSTVRPDPRKRANTVKYVCAHPNYAPVIRIRYLGRVVEWGSPAHCMLRVQNSKHYQSAVQRLNNDFEQGLSDVHIRTHLSCLFDVLVKEAGKSHDWAHLKDVYNKANERAFVRIMLDPYYVAYHNTECLKEVYKQFPRWMRQLVPVKGRNFIGFL